MSATGDAQQQLDTTRQYQFPLGGAGVFYPDAPLFVDTGCEVSQVRGGTVSSYKCSTILITGFRRGLVDDTHFPADGFRTNGDTILWSRGTTWDLGPRIPVGGVVGWPLLKTLVVSIDATANAGVWAGMIHLCGIQTDRGPYGPHPSPWQMTLYDRWGGSADPILRVAIKTADGVERYFDADLPAAAKPLPARSVFAFTADLDSGVVTGNVNGVSFTVGELPPNSTLAPNTSYPFSAGKLEPVVWTTGFYGSEQHPDLTIHAIRIGTAAGDFCQYAGGGRLPTYPGGPSLPLASAWTADSCNYLMVTHASQGVSDAVGDVWIHDFNLSCYYGAPAICLGAAMRPVTLERIVVDQGSRAFQTLGFSVDYPLTLRDFDSRNASDTALHIRDAILELDNITVSGSRRNAIDLLSCWGRVKRLFLAPGAVQRETVLQSGGQIRYDDAFADYEFAAPPDYAFLRVVPTTHNGQVADPTTADIVNVFGGFPPRIVAVEPADVASGYRGAVRATVDGVVVALSAGDA